MLVVSSKTIKKNIYSFTLRSLENENKSRENNVLLLYTKDQ